MQLLATLREKFWILKGGVAVKRITSKCIRCKRISPRLGNQIMAPLPSVRVDAGDHPFTYVGVDYFGPILVKRGRTMEKRYGCLFTCLKIRAVHLEIAHSLSSDSFLMALMRFIGRRGFPREIFSDNGSNLVGANNELRDCLKEWSQDRIHNYLLRYGIQWNFIPPAASHWGGVWERMVRSVKKVLNVLSNKQTMSDECLLTFMIEAERIVNNRPLTPLNTDTDDLEALTPAKLLLLRDNVITLGGASHSNQFIRRWRKANYLAEICWKRWVKEYISTLQQRQKWLYKERNFTPGDLVIVNSDINAKRKWPLGLVSQVFTGSDDLVRQVEVKTVNGYLIRDIRKLFIGGC